MNHQRLLPIVTAIAAAFAGTSLWLGHQWREERLLNAELNERLNAKSLVRIEQSPPPAPAASPERAAASGSMPPAAPTPETPGVTPARDLEGRRQWQEHQQRLLTDPRYIAEVKRQQRMLQASHRQHATGMIGLSDAQFDAAVDLWAEREIAMQSARMMASEGADVRAAQAAADETYEASLQKLLQEPLATRWKHYRDSLPTRMRITNLRAQLSGADALRDDQFEPLIEAMEVEQSQLRQELRRQRAELESGQRSTNQNWSDFQQREIEMYTDTKKRVLAAASPILSPSQLKQLGSMYEQEIESRRSNLRMNQLQQKIMSPEQPSGD